MDKAEELIPTRQSLLSRLKDCEDQESWRQFFDTYWRLIYSSALKAGLTDAEAQDAVQETVVSVFKSIPKFEYDPAKGSFKSWLLRVTQWRIKDQFRKRQKQIDQGAPSRSTDETAVIERIADPAGVDLEAVWEQEFEANLMEAAIERVKRRVDPQQYQVFDLYVRQEWPVSRIAKLLKVNAANVYLIKHRIGNLLKKELRRLREKPI